MRDADGGGGGNTTSNGELTLYLVCVSAYGPTVNLGRMPETGSPGVFIMILVIENLKVFSKHQGFLTKVVDFVLSSFFFYRTIPILKISTKRQLRREFEAGIRDIGCHKFLGFVFLVDAMMGR